MIDAVFEEFDILRHQPIIWIKPSSTGGSVWRSSGTCGIHEPFVVAFEEQFGPREEVR